MRGMPAQSHRSDPRILGRRTLQRDNRRLAKMLRPGVSVLDVGCGTGAITPGIAKAVGPHGYVVGVDRDEVLLDLARAEHATVPNLGFESGDATTLRFRAQFDIVTAARTLQWIAEPALAISKMKDAAKPAGTLVILDYNHTENEWTPDPPAEFRRFYSAFLAWRGQHHWDNQMADHLPELFRSVGLVDVQSSLEDEIVERGEPDFAERSALWSEVIENVGGQLATAGFCTQSQLEEARQSYASWRMTALVKQKLAMRAVTGTTEGAVCYTVLGMATPSRQSFWNGASITSEMKSIAFTIYSLADNSFPEASNRERPLLLPFALAIERMRPLPEVVKPGF